MKRFCALNFDVVMADRMMRPVAVALFACCLGQSCNVNPLEPEEVFYNDLDREEQGRQSKALKPFSYAMFKQKTTWAPWRHVAVSYLFCSLDRAVPVEVQKGMVESTGVPWREVMLEAGHSPFLSKVEETVEGIVGAVEGKKGGRL